jgi:hypothetical protein
MARRRENVDVGGGEASRAETRRQRIDRFGDGADRVRGVDLDKLLVDIVCEALVGRELLLLLRVCLAESWHCAGHNGRKREGCDTTEVEAHDGFRIAPLYRGDPEMLAIGIGLSNGCAAVSFHHIELHQPGIAMLPTRGYATRGATLPFEPFSFDRREPRPHDVLIQIAYCGVCHTDIHTARNEWGGTRYPLVPGHEIVGHVARVGSEVTRFAPGDVVGVGCFVDSCRECDSCRDGEEQFCERHLVMTYNSTESDRKTPTYGGYSSQIVVDENYVLTVPGNLPLEGVAPLLCAGITTYSPLRRFRVGPGQRVGVVGLGGLGHLAG